MLFGDRIDGYALGGEDRLEPLGCPIAFSWFIDPRQRLQQHSARTVFRKAGAEILPVTATGERRRADRAAEIERKNLRAIIAPELQRHQREQHRLARPGRPDD